VVSLKAVLKRYFLREHHRKVKIKMKITSLTEIKRKITFMQRKLVEKFEKKAGIIHNEKQASEKILH
jgi:hypothetical protein